jgi:formylmethanofuran dehydrogenase subunit E
LRQDLPNLPPAVMEHGQEGFNGLGNLLDLAGFFVWRGQPTHFITQFPIFGGANHHRKVARMNTAEALRSIRSDYLSYIQQRTQVEFDNRLQMPVHFIHGKAQRLVRELLGRFRLSEDGSLNGFLVRADDDQVYFLYFDRLKAKSTFSEGKWVLSFRILHDNELMALYRDERTMIVDMTVKRVVDFHGHLCPELVIGMKACEYAHKLFQEHGQPPGRISVLAENSTSALDALQVLFGVTFGNQGLQVLDYGKHNYTFMPREPGYGFTLRLQPQYYDNKEDYEELEACIGNSKITLDQVARFQLLLDARVLQLLASDPRDLFHVESCRCNIASMETPTVYVNCSCCGEQVLRERALQVAGTIYCVPCFELLKKPLVGQTRH